MNFGDMQFHGGIQNFGGQNVNNQHNVYGETPREQVEALLAQIREALPSAAPQVSAIESDIADSSPEARDRVRARLGEVAANAGHVRTVVEAVAAIGAIVAARWPF